MIKRRDFLKTAAAAGGTGLLAPLSGLASRKANSIFQRIDFQTCMPGEFDGKPFGPKELTALEDEAGVDRFVVFPEATLRPDNVGLAQRIQGHPRMIGGAGVNPTLGDEAVRELERSVKEFGFRGVRLSPVAHSYSIDADFVQPLVRKAAELGVPITIENGDTAYCSPARIAAVAGKFPEVPIILDTAFRAPVRPRGEPTGREMVEVMWKCPNLYLGLTALTTCQPAYLMSAVWAGGPDRVVFGSYAPSGIPLFARKAIEESELGPEAEAKIFGGTLRRLYQLDGRSKGGVG